MDFFQSKETLTVNEWILRAVVAFVFLIMVAKALGQRSISQLRLIDFVIALVIGNIIAQPLSDEKIALTGAIITTTVLVVLYVCGIYIILKFPAIRRLMDNAPIIVVKNGEILYKQLKKARISIDILLEELREQKADDVKKVALAIWEADGKFSVFLDPKYEPITPSFYKLQTEPFDPPRIIVKEGIINHKELSQINVDEKWVTYVLESQYNAKVKDVLLATIDMKGNLQVFLYN